MKNQPTGVNRIGRKRIAVMEQAVREAVPEVRARLLQEHVLNVGGERAAEDRIQFFAHLFEQLGDRAVLLRLLRVVEFAHLMPVCLEHMSQRVFQQRRQYVEAADEIALEEANKS